MCRGRADGAAYSQPSTTERVRGGSGGGDSAGGGGGGGRGGLGDGNYDGETRGAKSKSLAGRPKPLRAPEWNSSEGAAGAQAKYAFNEADNHQPLDGKEGEYGAYDGTFGYGGNEDGSVDEEARRGEAEDAAPAGPTGGARSSRARPQGGRRGPSGGGGGIGAGGGGSSGDGVWDATRDSPPHTPSPSRGWGNSQSAPKPHGSGGKQLPSARKGWSALDDAPAPSPAEPPRAAMSKSKSLAGRPKSLRAPKWNSSEGAAGAQTLFALNDAEDKKPDVKEGEYGAYDGSFGYGGNSRTEVGRCRLKPDEPCVESAWFQRLKLIAVNWSQTLLSMSTCAATPRGWRRRRSRSSRGLGLEWSRQHPRCQLHLHRRH